MDEELIRESLAGFDTLWQRVTGGRPHLPQPATALEEEAMLKTLIAEETCAAQYTAALARLFPGGGRAMLLRHAADAKRHGRRLRAEYFIRTGLTPDMSGNCPGVSGKLASLRDAMLRAGRRAEIYESAAEHTEQGELRQVYGSFLEEERLHARELRSLLIDSF